MCWKPLHTNMRFKFQCLTKHGNDNAKAFVLNLASVLSHGLSKIVTVSHTAHKETGALGLQDLENSEAVR